MTESNKKQIIKKIREGEIDVNNQSLFFPLVIKGLLLSLKKQLKVRGKGVPHFIMHTGDDTMYLSVKGQDASIEPLEISNEDYTYNSVPRCLVTVNGVDIESDQLTNPYVGGQLQFESENNIYTLIGEFRRVPIRMTVNCKYYVDSWGDVMELTQQIISQMAFTQTYNISYLGQAIKCSYTIPTSIESEYTVEMDGTTQDNKLRTTEISLTIETNMPVWQNRTIISSDDRITKFAYDSEFDKETRNAINTEHNIYYGIETKPGDNPTQDELITKGLGKIKLVNTKVKSGTEEPTKNE